MKSPDKNKAKSLLKNADSIFMSTLKNSEGTPLFYLINYYAAIIDCLEAFMAIAGYRTIHKDHHKESVEFLSASGWPVAEITLINNLRRIRNDILYYGTKSDKDIQDFYDLNKENIQRITEKLMKKIEEDIMK